MIKDLNFWFPNFFEHSKHCWKVHFKMPCDKKRKQSSMNIHICMFPVATGLPKWRSWHKAVPERILFSNWRVNSKKASFSSSLWNLPVWASYSGSPSPQHVSNNQPPLPGFPSWQFSSLLWGGLSKQIAPPGPGLIFRTLLGVSPTAGLAWQWKPRAQKETHKGRHVFNARAICQFSLGSFQELRGAKAGAEKGVCRGGQKNHSREKQLQYEKDQRRFGAGVDEWKESQGPSSQALNRSTAPSPMGLLSVAKHFKCYSQNMLLREDLIYTNRQKKNKTPTPSRGVFWSLTWKAKPPAFAEIMLGFLSFGSKTS